ncbi:diguanylate cyclase [Marinicrinis lubricantis]|uniref:Diguanylate cyclase n=1 Tax=Marinicrinis lubricantis TaxID=2086470 RepID=A0ABW1ITM2_9BACL
MFKRLSLKVKLAMVLLLVSVIPLGLFSALVTHKYDQAMEHAVKDQQTMITISTAMHLNEWLEMRISAIQEVIKQNESVFKSGNIERIMPFLKMLHYTDTQNISYSYATEEGMAYASDGAIVDFSVMNHSPEINKEKVTISDVIEDPIHFKKMVIISVPVLDEGAEYYGTVSSVMDVNALTRDITMMSSKQAGTAYLVSSEGMVLAHPNKEWVGKNIFEFEMKEDSSYRLESVLETSAGSTAYKDTKGIERIASFAEVETTGWRVVVSTEQEEILAPIKMIEHTGLLLLIGLMLVAAALSLLFSRVILRPILNISSLMKKVTAGDLSERLQVNSPDEIGLLNQNINMMLDSFTEKLRDLEKSMKSEQELMVRNILMDKQSKMDALTGLYNHKSYHEYMDKLIEQTQLIEFNLQLVIVDIDNFKKVNDTFGHAAGDIALTVVSERIMEHMDSNDFAARYGGEEFVILLTSKNDEMNARILEQIRASIEHTPIEEMRGANVTVSMGAYTVRRGDSKEKVFNEADGALYRAKRTGKNKIVIASDIR